MITTWEKQLNLENLWFLSKKRTASQELLEPSSFFLSFVEKSFLWDANYSPLCTVNCSLILHCATLMAYPWRNREEMAVFGSSAAIAHLFFCSHSGPWEQWASWSFGRGSRFMDIMEIIEILIYGDKIHPHLKIFDLLPFKRKKGKK